MPSFTYTKLSDFILDQLLGISNVNKIKNSSRYIAEDILGDPAANSNKVNATAFTAACANATAAARTRATGTSVAAGGVAISASSGSFSSSSSSYVDVTNLTVTIITSGRPVLLMLQHDGGGSEALVATSGDGGGAGASITPDLHVKFLRGATLVSESLQSANMGGDSLGQGGISWPPSAFQIIDAVAAGTYTYKIQAKTTNAFSPTFLFNNVKLVAYEL